MLNIVFCLYVNMFSFPHSGNEAKRSVKFRHSTRMQCKRFWRKMGSGNALTMIPSVYPAICGIQCEAKIDITSLGSKSFKRKKILIFLIIF